MLEKQELFTTRMKNKVEKSHSNYSSLLSDISKNIEIKGLSEEEINILKLAFGKDIKHI